jgi:hypothetical protein
MGGVANIIFIPSKDSNFNLNSFQLTARIHVLSQIILIYVFILEHVQK